MPLDVMLRQRTKTTEISCKFQVTDQQILDVILVEIATNKRFNYAELVTRAKLNGFLRSKFEQKGIAALTVRVTDEMLLYRQDVLSALKGVLMP